MPDAIPGVRFRVKHLKAGNSYVFIVRAENGIGIGPPSAISDLVTTKPASPESKNSNGCPIVTSIFSSEEGDKRSSGLGDGAIQALQ